MRPVGLILAQTICSSLAPGVNLRRHCETDHLCKSKKYTRANGFFLKNYNFLKILDIYSNKEKSGRTADLFGALQRLKLRFYVRDRERNKTEGLNLNCHISNAQHRIKQRPTTSLQAVFVYPIYDSFNVKPSFPLKWQTETERTTLPFLTLHPHFTMMQRDNFLNQR